MECTMILVLGTTLVLAPFAACRTLPDTSTETSVSYDSGEVKTVVSSASDIADLLLPFFQRQDIGRSEELSLLKKVAHKEDVEILPFDTHHIHKDGKLPLALILGSNDRKLNGRKKFNRLHPKYDRNRKIPDSDIIFLRLKDELMKMRNEGEIRELSHVDLTDNADYGSYSHMELKDKEKHKFHDTDLRDETKYGKPGVILTDYIKHKPSNEDLTEATDEINSDPTDRDDLYYSYMNLSDPQDDSQNLPYHEKVHEDLHDDKSGKSDDSMPADSLEINDESRDHNEVTVTDLNVHKSDDVSGEDAEKVFNLVAEKLGVDSGELGEELTIAVGNDVSCENSNVSKEDIIRLKQLGLASSEINSNETPDVSHVLANHKRVDVERYINGILKGSDKKDTDEPLGWTNKSYNLSFLFNR